LEKKKNGSSRRLKTLRKGGVTKKTGHSKKKCGEWSGGKKSKRFRGGLSAIRRIRENLNGL